jgi:hypothetical protein
MHGISGEHVSPLLGNQANAGIRARMVCTACFPQTRFHPPHVAKAMLSESEGSGTPFLVYRAQLGPAGWIGCRDGGLTLSAPASRGQTMCTTARCGIAYCGVAGLVLRCV